MSGSDGSADGVRAISRAPDATVSDPISVGSMLDSAATVVTQQSPQVAIHSPGQVVVRVEVIGLARDPERVEEPAFDTERLTDRKRRVFANPPSSDQAVFGDKPCLAVVLLAVEIRLGLAELGAELPAKVRHVSRAAVVGQPEPGADSQCPPVDGRGDDDGGEPLR
jgi:hypothetical protein